MIIKNLIQETDDLDDIRAKVITENQVADMVIKNMADRQIKNMGHHERRNMVDHQKKNMEKNIKYDIKA